MDDVRRERMALVLEYRRLEMQFRELADTRGMRETPWRVNVHALADENKQAAEQLVDLLTSSAADQAGEVGHAVGLLQAHGMISHEVAGFLMSQATAIHNGETPEELGRAAVSDATQARLNGIERLEQDGIVTERTAKYLRVQVASLAAGGEATALDADPDDHEREQPDPAAEAGGDPHPTPRRGRRPAKPKGGEADKG